MGPVFVSYLYTMGEAGAVKPWKSKFSRKGKTGISVKYLEFF